MSQPAADRLAPAHGEVRVVDDVAAAFTELAEQVTLRALESREGDGDPSHAGIALSGGDTARACYERLVASTRVPWTQVEAFLGDERCVPPDHADSNQQMIREVLIDHVPIAAFHPMECSLADEYDALLAECPPFDLLHLGLGPDGHTASLFPDSAALDAPATTFVVRNTDPSGRNKYERLTLTFGAINRSRLAVFTVSGAAKHDALHAVLSRDDLPACHVDAQQVIWLCDRDALGEDLDRVL